MLQPHILQPHSRVMLQPHILQLVHSPRPSSSQKYTAPRHSSQAYPGTATSLARSHPRPSSLASRAQPASLMPTACLAYPACLTGSNPCALNTQMINMPLFKCLLAALSVLSCVGAVAPSTTSDVAFDVTTAKMDPDMRRGRALGATPSPSPKDCAALNDETTCNTRDNKRVTRGCSRNSQNHKSCTKLCRTKNRKLSGTCKEACCRSSPSPPPPSPPPPSPPPPSAKSKGMNTCWKPLLVQPDQRSSMQPNTIRQP